MKLDVIFENDDLLVINKPSGIMVHSDGKKEARTIADLVREEYPETTEVGEPITIDGKTIDRPGIVHRLDEETSGALIIAKTQEAFMFLKSQFQERKVEKTYHAFVWGHFKEVEGIVDVPIGRNANDFRRWHAGRGVRGEVREATTRWKVLSQFKHEGEGFSFMELSPKTGRTHQLRVHMKYIQRPIVGDMLYAPTKPYILGFNRLALHARHIAFIAPNGDRVSVEAPYEADFKAALAQYANL